MNDRIKELAIECTDYVTGSLDGDHEVFDKERFARLIIQECIKLSGDAGIYCQSVFEDLVKEHFGVE